MTLRRVLDILFCSYFALQFPSTVFFDSQSLLPSWIYPKWLQNVFQSYLAAFRDPFMGDPSSFPWFMAISIVEFLVEIPFYIVATYAYYKGATKCPWIRMPALVYSIHINTAVLGVLFTICIRDFRHYTVTAPRNYQERFNLFFCYFPFLVVCILITLDTCFSSVYTKEREKME